MRDRVEMYNNDKGEWRWRFVAAENGHVLAHGGQAYSRRVDAYRAAARVVGRLRLPRILTLEHEPRT